MATIPGFFGREAELAWLLRLWNDTAIRDEKGARAGPRMAILIAETGLGKSRLVQALYQLLTNDPFWNPSDKSYWPSEARQSVRTTTVGSQRDLNSAFAYDREASRLPRAANPNEVGPAWRYQGGPKSR